MFCAPKKLRTFPTTSAHVAWRWDVSCQCQRSRSDELRLHWVVTITRTGSSSPFYSTLKECLRKESVAMITQRVVNIFGLNLPLVWYKLEVNTFWCWSGPGPVLKHEVIQKLPYGFKENTCAYWSQIKAQIFLEKYRSDVDPEFWSRNEWIVMILFVLVNLEVRVRVREHTYITVTVEKIQIWT